MKTNYSSWILQCSEPKFIELENIYRRKYKKLTLFGSKKTRAVVVFALKKGKGNFDPKNKRTQEAGEHCE